MAGGTRRSEDGSEDEPTRGAAPSTSGEATGTADGGSGDAAPAPQTIERPPVEDWDRYGIVGYLGGGGMGKVFKAHDPRLDRHVAVKFIRGDVPELVERFKREAQAQAHVEHDHICRVYEVGDVEGHPYIAMQLIDGLPLGAAARHMNLEQKLIVVKEVAEALHEAHRTGLVHRDVKPSNILVERTDDGRWKPFVVDFGLAREQESAGVTVTGAVIGTPYYMPPEQALGRTHLLDRRSDVYSLGASLYTILTGHPPFQAPSSTEILQKVLQDVPDPLRRSDGSIPQDVDAIVMKCLRKDPQERYASARALADDLGRYLDGEPIEARRTTFVYRLRMKARKHRLAVGVGAVATVLIAVSAGWGGYTRLTAARRARLAQAFGQQVERMDAAARFAHTVPLHDVRPDLEKIRDRMRSIEERMKDVGRIATGPGHYALGRGSMAMEAYDQGRRHLEAAWDSGYREPDVALALGRLLGIQYRHALRETEAIPSHELREARRREIERTYLEPAVRYLKQGAGAETESPDYVAALLAFCERRYDDALASARAAYTQTPWTYEARQLEGDVLAALAADRGTRGDYDGAREDFRRAAAAYKQAAVVGRSDPGVYGARCALFRSAMAMELEGPAADVEPYFKEGLAACDRALDADPQSVDNLVVKAGLYWRLGEFRRKRGEDPRDALHEAIRVARQALAIRNDDAGGHGTIGNAWLDLATFAKDRGEDPHEPLAHAAEAFERSIALGAGPGQFNNLGLVYKELAVYGMSRGEDPRVDLGKAVEAYRRSLEVEPRQVAANTNLGTALYQQASYEGEHGVDPRASFGSAIEAFNRAIEINPNQNVVLYNLGRAYGDQAVYLGLRGEDPRPMLHRAADAYRRAIEVNPDSAYVSHFYNGMGTVLDSLARNEWEAGADPHDSLTAAIDAYRESIARNPGNFYPQGNLALTWAFRAECEINRGLDPGPSTERAMAAASACLKLKPDHALALDALGFTHWIRARADLRAGTNARGSLDDGRGAFRKALALNPDDSLAHLGLGRLLTVEGRFLASRGDDAAAAFEGARREIEEAIRLDDTDADSYLAAASLDAAWSRWLLGRGADPAKTLGHGIEMVDKSLAGNPRKAEATAVRGELLLLSARTETTADRRLELTRQAREALGDALSRNANLKHEFEALWKETGNPQTAGS